MTHPFRATMALVAGLVAYGSAAQAQGDPPGRVGRLAFAEGSVSFHDQDDSAWSKAIVNTPLTSGDSVWTEPNAHSELSVAGTRLRLDGGTQLDVLALDDSQTRLQLGQGRLDVKTYTLDTKTPYQIVTPRGTITLQQQGDYYVEAGSTQDATRLGVRSGSAQLLSLNGQTLTVRAGEVGEIYGDVGTPQLRTVNSAPPALPTYWAARDRQVTYDPPTQYLSAGMTGYEDMNAYGSWSNDTQYGSVWTPRSVPSDWQPYHSGHWSNVKPWGWTWIDDQPWGYAPYHYGRWANRNNHWVWVPPQRDVQPVYAPALVAFIGGIELSVTLGNQNNAPVGWFPLGPRETYVPSYTTDRDYYNRINRSAQIQQNVLDDRWQRTQRHEPAPAASGNVLLNQRFAIVVPSETFVRSQPVARAALKVAPEKLAAAPVALVAAPPAPTASLAVAPAPAAGAKPVEPKPAEAKPDAQAKAGANANLPVAKTAVTDMPTLGKPAMADKPAAAPGPKIAPVATATPAAHGTQPAAPALVPRTGAAPPALKDDKAPTTPAKPAPTEATAPNRAPVAPNSPVPPPKPDAKSDAKPEAKPAQAEPPKTANVPPPATQATPTVRPEAKPAQAEPPKAASVPPPATPTAKPENKPAQAEPPKAAHVPAPTQAAPASPAAPVAPQARPQPSVAAPAAPREPNTKENGAHNTAAPAPAPPAQTAAPHATAAPAPAVSEAKPNEPKKVDEKKAPDDKK